MASQPVAQAVQLPNFRSLPSQRVATIFRSGALSELTAAAQKVLWDNSIHCIVDLREAYEIAAAPDLTDRHTYLNIPLYRGQVPLAAAIDDVYHLLIMERGHQIAAAIQAIAENIERGVIVHCKAGKDRTGLVVAMLMAASGVSTDEIVADYAQSAENLSPIYRRQMIQQLETELGDNPAGFATAMRLHMASPGAAVERALHRVDEEFGSAKQYLATHGVCEVQLQRLHKHFSAVEAVRR